MYVTAAGFQSKNYSSRRRITITVAALVLVSIDYLTTSKFEFTNIWTPPFRSVKLFYLWSRYLGLFSQMIHYILIHTQLSNAPVSSAVCRAWIVSQLICSVTLLLILDAVLFLRVYALYQQSKHTFWLLLPIAGQTAAIAYSTRRNLFQQGDLDEVCDYNGSSGDAIMLCIVVLFTHICIWAATFMRRHIANGQAVVVKMVVVESSWALAMLFAMLSAITPYSSMKHRISPFFILSWSIALESIMCCRLIMNMRQLKVESCHSPQQLEGDNEDNQYVLSTIVPFDDLNSTTDVECQPEESHKPCKDLPLEPV